MSENIFQEILQNTALHNITKHKEGFNMFAASLYIYTDKVKHGGDKIPGWGCILCIRRGGEKRG